MKIDVFLLIGAALLAFIHTDAAQVAATATVVLLTVRIEQQRRKKRRVALYHQ